MSEEHPTVWDYKYTSVVEMPESHRQVVRTCVRLFGDKRQDDPPRHNYATVAAYTGVDERIINAVMVHPVGRAYYEKLCFDLNHKQEMIEQLREDKLEELVDKSLDTLRDVLDNSDADLKLKAQVAQDILDRSPGGKYAKTKKVDKQPDTQVLTSAGIRRLHELAGPGSTFLEDIKEGRRKALALPSVEVKVDTERVHGDAT